MKQNSLNVEEKVRTSDFYHILSQKNHKALKSI